MESDSFQNLLSEGVQGESINSLSTEKQEFSKTNGKPKSTEKGETSLKLGESIQENNHLPTENEKEFSGEVSGLSGKE